MTGLERLRGFALRMDDLSVWPGSAKLLDIADQIEREMVPRPSVLAADGEPLEVGQTVWHVTTGHEYTISGLTNGGAHLSKDRHPGGYCRACYLTHQRPVLDADGVLVKVGDIVYANADERGDGTAWHVVGIDASLGHSVSAERADGTPGGARDLRPDWLTHKKPVFDADGVPIKTRDTVYEVDGTGHAFYVLSVRHGNGDPLTPTVVTCDEGDGTSEHFLPDQLTHTKPEPPDSWDRIEKDAEKTTCSYFGMEEYGYGCSECPVEHWKESCDEVKSKDLVRRCKELAGVSE